MTNNTHYILSDEARDDLMFARNAMYHTYDILPDNNTLMLLALDAHWQNEQVDRWSEDQPLDEYENICRPFDTKSNTISVLLLDEVAEVLAYFQAAGWEHFTIAHTVDHLCQLIAMKMGKSKDLGHGLVVTPLPPEPSVERLLNAAADDRNTLEKGT